MESERATDELGATPSGELQDAPQQAAERAGSRAKLWAALGGIALVAILVLTTFGLYQLGDESQSALERLRDIAVIYVVLMSLIIVVLMAAGTAAMIFLVLQIKNQLIPIIENLSGTIHRVRGTTEYMSEEAVKPMFAAAGRAAQLRAMVKVITGRGPR
jgi:hypothetical protein